MLIWPWKLCFLVYFSLLNRTRETYKSVRCFFSPFFRLSVFRLAVVLYRKLCGAPLHLDVLPFLMTQKSSKAAIVWSTASPPFKSCHIMWERLNLNGTSMSLNYGRFVICGIFRFKKCAEQATTYAIDCNFYLEIFNRCKLAQQVVEAKEYERERRLLKRRERILNKMATQESAW